MTEHYLVSTIESVGETLDMIHSTQPIFHIEQGNQAKYHNDLKSAFCLTDLRDGSYSQKLVRVQNYKALLNKLPMTSPLCASRSLSMESTEVRNKDDKSVMKVKSRAEMLKNREVTGTERPRHKSC